MKVIEIYAGLRTDGTEVMEEVVVESVGENEFLLLQSPGLALGLAAGDIFRISGKKRFEVVRRGGNVSIQIFHREEPHGFVEVASPMIFSLGGRLDGRSEKQVVYTIPVSVGFSAMESTLNALKSRYPSVNWYYGNVYDENDGVTPLNWWEDRDTHN